MQGGIPKLLFGGSVIFLLLVLANITLIMTNRTLQEQVASRNQFIQQSLQLEKIYQPLVRALAELAATRGDNQIKDLLNAQGINFSATPTPTTSTTNK